MLKRKAYAEGTGTLSEESTQDSVWRQLGMMALWALLGLLAAHTTVYGEMAPFGVGAAAAASGPGAIVVYLATSAGYLLPGGASMSLRYLAAVAAAAGIRWALSGLPHMTGSRVFPPVVAFLSTLCTGLAMATINGISVYTVAVTVCESLLAGGFSYFFVVAVETVTGERAGRTITMQQQASVIITGAVVLMAMAGLDISGISPGRILSVIVILLAARCGKEQGGAVAGIVLGVAMALATPDYAHLAVAYAFSGLVAGIFSRFGRLAAAGVFLVTNSIVAVSSGDLSTVIISLYEVLAGCILFVVLPSVLDRKINGFFTQAQDVPAVEGLRRSVVLRLDVASKAMAEVAGTVDAVSKKLAGVSAPDLGSVYFGVSEDVCRVCGLRAYCWDKAMSDTMASLNDLTPILREQGQVGKKDVGGQLGRHCTRLDEVVQSINRGYSEHMMREGAFRRLAEIRSVVTDQFSGMAELLSEFAADFSNAERVDNDAAERVRQVCEMYNMDVQEAVCTIGRAGRMQVEILASDVAVKLKQEEWHREICDACGRDFDHPVTARIGDVVKIVLTEQPKYTVKVGSAQLNCNNERLCGDAIEAFADGNGHMVAVLSDGMGSGGRAAVDGAMAAGLTARLLKAGFGEDSVLRMVNSALMVKSGDESLATLDVMSIDLFTGRLQSLKAGAASSLLLSGGRVSRIERSSLPVGILRDISFEKWSDTLGPGDVLLMFSDGVLTDGIGWVEQKLLEFDPKQNSLRSLCESIVTGARQLQQKSHQDDISVIALRVDKR